MRILTTALSTPLHMEVSSHLFYSVLQMLVQVTLYFCLYNYGSPPHFQNYKMHISWEPMRLSTTFFTGKTPEKFTSNACLEVRYASPIFKLKLV